MIQPVEITARRPIRSDQLPLTNDTPALTTWIPAHINGTNFGLPAACVRRRSRNASVEFPSAKIERMIMKRLNDAGKGSSFERFKGFERFERCAGFGSRSGIKKIRSTEIAPGTIVSAKSVR